MKDNYYLRTDELVEAVKGLEMFLSNIRKVKKDLYFWKWAIIALHNSVQGFMVCALRGTNGLSVLTPECAKAWLEAYENNTTYPKEILLDDFLNLYKKIKGKYMLQYVHSKKFVPMGQEGRSIKRLNRLRNEFIHFTPQGRSLKVSGLPQLCGDVLKIIDFLVNSSGNIHFDSDQDKFKKRLDIVFSKGLMLTKGLKKAYNA